MGRETLQTLAEIKMHVCDEHLVHTEMKTRLKCCFGTVDLLFVQQGMPPPPPPSTHTAQQIPVISFAPGGHPDSPSDHRDVAEQTAEDTPPDDQNTQLLSTIVYRFIQQGELDNGEIKKQHPKHASHLIRPYPARGLI